MTQSQRASQIWSLLICAARERKSYTYGDLAKILNFGGAGVLSNFLAPIMWFCEDKNYPPLTILVVNRETGIHGNGLIAVEDDINKTRESVFNFDWFSLEPPQNIDFEDSRR